jgi:hypothetical protein
VKKCVSCGKDLPDTALHCVFCGAKQPAAPAPPPAAAPETAKTVMGFSAADLIQNLPPQNRPGAPAPQPVAPPRPGPAPMASSPMAPPPMAPPPMAPPHGPLPGMGGMGGPPPGMGGMGGPPPGMGGMGGPPPGMGGMGGPPPGMGGMGGPPPGMGGMGGPPPGMGGMGGPPPGMGAPPPAAHAPTAFVGGPSPFPPPGPSPMAPPPMAPAPPPMAPPAPAPSPMASASTVFMEGGPMRQPMPSPGPAPGPSPMSAPSPMAAPPPMAPPAAPPMAAPVAAPRPPYLASQTAQRAARPIDAFAGGLQITMIVFGVILIAAFNTPVLLEPEVAFWWKDLGDLPGKLKLLAIWLPAAGLLGILLGAIPMPSIAKAAGAAVLGLVPILFAKLALPEKIEWREIVGMVGPLLLPAGLLLRDAYRDEIIGRLLTTIGAVCVLALYFIPEHSKVPVVEMFKAIPDVEGKEAIALLAITLLPFLLALVSLIAWMPGPGSAGGKVLAWIWILLPVITLITMLLVLGHIGDKVKVSPFMTLFTDPLESAEGIRTDDPVALLSGWLTPAGAILSAYLAFFGYGLAGLLGKNFEPKR